MKSNTPFSNDEVLIQLFLWILEIVRRPWFRSLADDLNDLKGLKLPRWGICCLPLTHRVKMLQKNKSWTSHIMHYTSQITYCIWISKFYKILVIKRVGPLNSIKLIPKKFVKYFFDKNYWIDNTNVYVKSNIFQTNHFKVKRGTFRKVRLASNSWKINTIVFFSSWIFFSVHKYKQICLNAFLIRSSSCSWIWDHKKIKSNLKKKKHKS